MYAETPRRAQISRCLMVFSNRWSNTKQISEGRRDLFHPVSPLSALLTSCQSLLERQKKHGHLPGIRVALELLSDIPQEVMLRQEKGRAQSQELPALPGDTR